MLTAVVALLPGAAGILRGDDAEAPVGEAACERVIDMRSHWDDSIPLANPHKGWYHHFPDNHPDKYVIAQDADLLEFPGMDHLYIRLAWSYLEPQEGEFRWDVIDGLIDKWVTHGLGISFRISCKETSTDRIEQQFATPKWVMEAGAEGGYYRRGETTGPDGPWEPRFDDLVFLEKLENFLRAFAARYDGKPWLRYIDIGSIGDWGEGHTSSGSRIAYDFEQRLPHVDLHCKYFRKTQLVISDDFVYSIGDVEQRQRMHQTIVDRGIAYRDDSILVDYYVRAYSKTWTVRSPQFFADTWRRTPQVFELQHYGAVKKDGNWVVRPGSSAALHGDGQSGPDYFRGALELLHATYIGYHGDARDWLDDNPELTVELLNRCGYWFFLHDVRVPETWHAGTSRAVTLTWENRGVAPAYEPFQLHLCLRGPQTEVFEFDSGNQRWLPLPDKEMYAEKYALDLPEDLESGDYSLQLKLYSPAADRDVLLALAPELRDRLGYYTVGKVRVE
jgi:hypothetical protein